MILRRSGVVLVIVTVAVTAGLGFSGRGFSPLWFNNSSSDRELLLSGNIEAHESVLSFQIVQSRITSLPVEEGQWVAAGAVIARVDDADYRQRVANDEANLRVQQAQLQLLLAGSRRQDIEAAKQTVLDDHAQMNQARLDFERAQSLWQSGASSRQNRDLAETAWRRASAAYQRDKQLYDKAREGSRKEDIAIARANVQKAREALVQSRILLGYTVLRAPIAGVILVRQAELGEVMQPGTPVVTMADLNHVWLRAYVSETDLGRVRWDQPAALSSDTYPGKSYRGRVSFIASKAEFTPKSVETHKERVTLVYRIKIDVDNSAHELKPGMPADAVIQLGEQAANG